MGIRSFGTGDWQGVQGHIHAKEALEWLIYEKLKLTVEEIPYRIGSNTFRQYGLGGMFSEVFHRSVAKALEIVYPGRFTTLDLQRAKHNQARRN